MEEKGRQAKVYDFKPREGPRLKTNKYVSPEKKELMGKRKKARVDKKNFYTGVAVLLIIIFVITLLRIN